MAAFKNEQIEKKLKFIIPIVGAAFLGYLFKDFLIALILAGVFAAILYPLVHQKWKWIKSVKIKSAIVTFGFVLVVFGPVLTALSMGIVVLRNRVADLKMVPGLMESETSAAKIINHPLIHKFQAAVKWPYESLKDNIEGLLERLRETLSHFLESIAVGLPNTGISIFLLILALFWILKDWKTIEKKIFAWSPFTYEKTDLLWREFKTASRSIIVAGSISGALQAIVLACGAAITDIANPWAVALCTFLASFFPVIGTGAVSISLIISSIALMDNFRSALIFLPFAFAASIVDNFVYPFLIGSRSQINALLAILSVLGGVTVFGIFGIFLGPLSLILTLKIFQILEPTD